MGEAEEMRTARRQARHSVRIALRRAQHYSSELALTTYRDWQLMVDLLQRAENHLSTMEGHYGS